MSMWSYSLRSFALQSPLMPYNGDSFAIHYDSKHKQIFLFSPRICDNGHCSYSNHVISYSISNNTFTVQKATPEPMYLLEHSKAAVSIQHTIYFNEGSNLVLGSYNIQTSEWKRPFKIMPHSVLGACLTTDDRYIYVIGGRDLSYVVSYHFQIFDLQNDAWLSSTSSLGHNRVWSTCEIVDGTIYVFGGMHDTDIRESIEMIFVGSGDDVTTNVATQIWKVLPETLYFQAMLLTSVLCKHVDTSLIYLLGGWRSSPHDIIEIFDVNTHSLTKLGFTLNQARAGSSAICIDNYIYVLGGRTDGDNRQQTTNSWEKSNMLYYIAPEKKSFTTITPTVMTSASLTNAQTVQMETSIKITDGTDTIMIVLSTALVALLVLCIIACVYSFYKEKSNPCYKERSNPKLRQENQVQNANNDDNAELPPPGFGDQRYKSVDNQDIDEVELVDYDNEGVDDRLSDSDAMYEKAEVKPTATTIAILAKHTQELKNWLIDHQLDQYLDNFVANGYHSLDFVKDINNIEELIEIGVKNKKDQNTLMSLIQVQCK